MMDRFRDRRRLAAILVYPCCAAIALITGLRQLPSTNNIKLMHVDRPIDYNIVSDALDPTSMTQQQDDVLHFRNHLKDTHTGGRSHSNSNIINKNKKTSTAAQTQDDAGNIAAGVPVAESDGIIDLTEKIFFQICGGSEYVFVMFKQDGCSACDEDAATFVELAQTIKAGSFGLRLNPDILGRVQMARASNEKTYGATMVDLFKIEYFPAYRLCIPNFSKTDVSIDNPRWFQHGRDGDVLDVSEARNFIEASIHDYERDGLFAVTGREQDRGTRACTPD